jgi:hypothetical protein
MTRMYGFLVLMVLAMYVRFRISPPCVCVSSQLESRLSNPSRLEARMLPIGFCESDGQAFHMIVSPGRMVRQDSER